MSLTTKIRKVIKNYDETDINGFKKVLYSMIEEKNQSKFNEINNNTGREINITPHEIKISIILFIK